MRMRWLSFPLFVLAALVAAVAVDAATPVQALFERAESIRSADPAAFGRTIEEIARRRIELSASQREQLAYLQAYRLAFTGNYAAAIPRLKELNQASPDTEVRFRAGALLVNIYSKSRRFTEGLRQLGDTLVQLDSIRDSALREHALLEAAYIHNEVGQYRLGLHYAERVLEGEPIPRSRCFAEYLRFDAMQNLGILPRDDTPLESAIEQCDDIKEGILANSIRTTLARKWVGERKRESAIALLRKHMAQVEAAGYPFLAVQFKSLMAELMLEKGDTRAAESFASEAVALSRSVGNTYALVSAYETLYRLAERRRDDETALVYYRRFAEADKAYLNEVKARELAYQIVRQETLEKSQQIQRLDSQNQLLQLQRELEMESGQSTRLVVVLLVMLLASIGYWAYRTKRTQMSFKRLAETDALTGICNRSHFTRQAERLLSQCERSGQEAVLVMFDLDHFKTINDRYGHASGDWVLRKVAEIGSDIARRIDVFSRLGGEEFAFLLHGCDLPSAARLAELCRTRIAAIDTTETGHQFPVSASFGVTCTTLGGYQLARLMSIADATLYRAKHEGRNRVCVHEVGNISLVNPQRDERRRDGDGESSLLMPEASLEKAGI